MKYCSRHNIGVITCLILQMPWDGFKELRKHTEQWFLDKGYEWKQLVLPGFDQIMGV